ncbi:DUF1579 family protein [Streptomyces justiciae]|uniref:DUF1579 family protein n=1 Tax=Streptomyces justiciae TaxID=2780140 RepID=UPI00187E25FB|nr:DUF1579 family protein [Streptomyces justiciae]MBE8471999.1 DUF1579 family protein [Streptomyces justiciae]
MPATTHDTIPRPLTPGPEMAELARFCRDMTWTGLVEAGGMGPGTPAMTARGRGTHESIQDGRWIVGTYEQDQYLLDGTHVLTWQLHWVVGWAPQTGDYRATLADNYGRSGVLRGRIDGDRLIFEQVGEEPVRLRLVWDANDPQDPVWSNETSADGGPWTLVEAYHCTPVRPRPREARDARDRNREHPGADTHR